MRAIALCREEGKMRRWCFMSVVFLLLTCISRSYGVMYYTRDYVQSQKVFDEDSIAEVHITMDPDSLAWLLAYENVGNYRYLHADFSFKNEHVPEEIVRDVGFRLRGIFARYRVKKSFKISFDAFEPSGRFHGLKKMNINADSRDPCRIASKLCYDLFSELGVPAARETYVKLYINGEYMGLYFNVEEIDKTFLRSRFGSDAGDLYQGWLYPADLTYRADGDYQYEGTSWTDFAVGRVYRLKTNEEQDDYSSLAHFIDVLNNTPFGDLEYYKAEIEKVFDADGFLQWLAANTILGSWDSYWVSPHNYYLYHDPRTGTFRWIPCDYNQSIYVNKDPNNDLNRRNIYRFGPLDSSRPLVRNLFFVPEYRDAYAAYILQIITKHFSLEVLEPKIERIKNMIQSAVEADPYMNLSELSEDSPGIVADLIRMDKTTSDQAFRNFSDRMMQYTVDEFYRSFDEGVGKRSFFGLRPFISTRIATAFDQLLNIPPVIFHTSPSPVRPRGGQPVTVTATVVDNHHVEVGGAPRSAVDRIVLNYDVGEGYQEVPMYDDGAHGDLEADDYVFGAQIPGQPDGTVVHYYIWAQDVTQKTATDPGGGVNASYAYTVGQERPLLFINELMADNEEVIQDEAGEYEDWFELYNASDETIHLGGMYLTDDLNSPKRWPVPDTLIAPGGFLLFWADRDEDQGPLHTHFSLDRDGEQLGLFDTDAMSNMPIDTLTFGPQAADTPWGRWPDGGGEWRAFDRATPGQSNGETAVGEATNGSEHEGPARFALSQNCPNPFNARTLIRYSLASRTPLLTTLKIYDLLGREVATLVHQKQSAGSYEVVWEGKDHAGIEIASGIYVYRIQAGDGVGMKKLLLLR